MNNLSKTVIKHIKSLKIKKYREIEKQFIAEGKKIIDDLIQSGAKLDKLVITNTFDISTMSVDKDKVFMVSEAEMSNLSSLKNAPGILAVFHIYSATKDIPKDDWILALDRINDPGNLGTLIRIADWFGINDIVLSEGSVDVYNSKVIQASMGSIARVNFHFVDLKNWLEQEATRREIYGGLLDGQDVRKIHFQKKGVLLIGSEAHGISEDLLPFITQGVFIPRIGNAESLNASVAAGIIAAFACL
ncbi:MAG: RNA methyltransferase [Chitinophagales bacterium]|nr:RNA methyltransferase [Chitinophagales bacterium]